MASVSTYVRGDFQTPDVLAEEVWSSLGSVDAFGAILEPTVGTGAFLRTAPPGVRDCCWICRDLNEEYLDVAREAARARGIGDARFDRADAFALDEHDLEGLDPTQPLLAIGNPPWVTSAGQARFAIRNLPEKANARFGLAGLDALTGSANFDIAEAILLRLLDAVAGFEDVTLAFLVKRSVAMKLGRRLLDGASALSFARIDAKRHFGASVDAGLFVCRLAASRPGVARHIEVSDAIGAKAHRRAGFSNGRFVDDLAAHGAAAHLEADDPIPWRQGVKHDLAKVLELTPVDGGTLVNGLGEELDLEPDSLCPLYKSSDVANGREPRRVFPLFQADLSGPIPDLRSRWPLLAAYLERHQEAFAARKSRIYAGKPPFSIFGVGGYVLAPWKVVVSGMYSSANFRVVGPSRGGQPPLVDDTCYLLPFEREEDAEAVADHLNGEGPQGLIRSLANQGAKRPLTKALLARVAIPLPPAEPAGSGDQRLALT